MKNTNTNANCDDMTETELDDMMGDCGPEKYPTQPNYEWMKQLESRLERQRREFASLLDHASEKPSLMRYCKEMRLEIEETRRQLSRCRLMQLSLN